MNEPFLVAVDFSELTEITIDRAAALASGQSNRIDLLHVVKPPRVPSRGNRAARELVEHAQKKHKATAQRKLEALAERIPEALRGQIKVLQGLPADVIVAAAKEGYSMVILATNGRTGLSHTLLGSVAERVVRYAPVPVLVVR